MTVVKDERIVDGPDELPLLDLTVHEMMPAEQRALARFGLRDEQTIIVALEIATCPEAPDAPRA